MLAWGGERGQPTAGNACLVRCFRAVRLELSSSSELMHYMRALAVMYSQ